MSTSNSQQILDRTEPLGGVKHVKPPIKPKPVVPPRPKETPGSENKSPLLSPTSGPLSPSLDIPSALKISQLTGPQPYGTRRASLKRWSSSVGEEVNQDNNLSTDLPAKSTAQPVSAPLRPLQTGAVWKGKSPFMLTTRGWGEQRLTQSRDYNESESTSQKPASSLVSKDTVPQKKETTTVEENKVVNLKSHGRITPEEKVIIPNIEDSKASTEKLPSRVSEDVKIVSSGSDSSNRPPEIREFKKQISPSIQSDLHVENSKHVSQYDHTDIMVQSTGPNAEEKVPSIPVRKSLPMLKSLTENENVKNTIISDNQIPLEGSGHILLHDDTSVDQGHLENRDKNHQPGAHVDLHDVQQIGEVKHKKYTQDINITSEQLSQYHDKHQPKDNECVTSELSPPKPKERKKPSVQFNVPKTDDQAEGEISLDYKPTIIESAKQEIKEHRHANDGNADMRRWRREDGIEEKPSSYGQQKTYEESVEVKQGMSSGVDELSDFLRTQMTSYTMTADNGILRKDMINKAPTDYTRSHGSERHDAPIPELIDVGQPDVQRSSFHPEDIKVNDEEAHSISHTTRMYENVKHGNQDVDNKQLDDDVEEDHHRSFHTGRPEADLDVKNMTYMPHFTHTPIESSPAPRSQNRNDHKDGSQYYNVHSPNVQDGEKLEHGVDEPKDHRYSHSHLEGPLHEHAQSGELVQPYPTSQGLVHTYEPSKKPINTCASSKEIGKTYAPSEELVHTYKSSEEPVNIYAQPTEPSRTYTQFEEPDHTYVQSEELVHTSAQSEEPVKTYQQSEQMVHPYAQSEEPMQGYPQSEEEMHKYAVLKTAHHASDESDNLVYTYKQPEEPTHHNIQSEEECQGYAVLKKAKFEIDQSEKLDKRYDPSEESIPHNVQSEELLHRYQPSKTSSIRYEQSEKQVDSSEQLPESYPQDTQPKEPAKECEHAEKTFVKYAQPEDPETIISHVKQLDELHYKQTQAQEPISKNYQPEKIISNETPLELPNYQQAQSEELDYQKEESKEQNYLQAQSHETNYKLAHLEEPNYLKAQSKGPNYKQPQLEDPDYQHAQSKEPCYYEKQSEEPNYQQARSEEPNYQQARSEEPNYQQSRSEEPNYQQSRSEEPNYQQSRSEEPDNQQARSDEPNSQQARSEELQFGYTQPESLKYKDKSSEESHLINYNLEQSQKDDVQTPEGKPKAFAEKNSRFTESTEQEYMDLHAVETDSKHVTLAEQSKVENRPEIYLEQQHGVSPPEYLHKNDSTSEAYHKELLSKEQETRHVQQEGTFDAHTVKPELRDVPQEQTCNRHSQSHESHSVESEDTRTDDRLDKHTYIEKNINGQSELNESEYNEDMSDGQKRSEEIREESLGESVSDTEETPEESNFDFLEGTGVLDTSLMRGRASLGKKRCHRTPATGTCTSQEETDSEYWMFRDSTEPKSSSEKEAGDEEKEETSTDCTPENSPTSVKSPTKKGGIFSGKFSPSILKGRLKSRNKASEEQASKTEPKESQEPTSPGKDKSESSSHSLNWLQALKKKKKKQPK